MSVRALPTLLLVIALVHPTAGGRQGPDDPALRAAVERFFTTQETEDVEAYLALWSDSSRSPQRRAMLKFVFSTGDDRFSDIEIIRVTPAATGVRVRVSATRDRTEQGRTPDAVPVTRRSRMLVSLTYTREGTEWKLLREAPAADDLAQALLESTSTAERDALLGAEPELLTDRLLIALSGRGTEAAQQQQYRAAQMAFELTLEVARRLGNREAEGEALQNLGNTHYFQRNLPAALDAYDARLVLERDRGNDAGVAAALSGVATVRYSYAEYGAAFSAYRAALAIQERLGDSAAAATTLISTGNVLYLQGDYDGAIRDYTRSRDIHRKILDTFGEARSLEGLGRVLMARGDYAAALQAFTGVLEEGRARNDRSIQGKAALNIGEAHFRLGNLDTARSTFEQSRGHFEASRDLANAGRVWQSIALTDLVAGRFAAAEDGYRRSAAGCASAVDQECVAGATVGLAFAHSAQEEFVDAIASYRKAIEMFTAQRRVEQAARAEVGLSAALLGNHENEAAVDAAGRARLAGAELDNDDVLWRAHVAEARALRRLQQRDRARDAVRTAGLAVERLLQSAALRPSTPVARDSSAVFALQAVLDAEAGDATAAFEAAERLRVHELRVALIPAERDIALGMTDQERDEERGAVADIVSRHAQVTREQGLPRPDAERLERLRRSLDDATAARAAQQQRLFARLPELRTWRGMMSPASRADVQALLANSDAVVVQFVVDDHDLLVLRAQKEQDRVPFAAEVFPIARQVLAAGVAALVQPETLRTNEAWRQATTEFFKVLPASLFEALRQAPRAIVIPHEVLWRVPFEALVVENRYLAEGTVISYAPSLTALVRAPAPPAQSFDAPPALVGAADPHIARSLRDFIAQTTPGWTLRSSDEAAHELAQVVADVSTESAVVAVQSGATETALRSALPTADIIHLAVPFRVNAASPLFSPMLLADEPADLPPVRSTADGTLELREIMNLPLHASVAVLSDGGALAMRDAAADAATIQWGWRAAGVPALLVARWGGDAAGSPALLAEFHRRLRAGDSAARALQAARAELRAHEAFKAPVHWAGWLLVATEQLRR